MGKLILHSFECECGRAFDELVKSDVRQIPCKCGRNAQRIITPVRLDYVGMAMSDGMETAIDKFDRVHRQQREIERKNLREHGEYWPNRSPGG